MRSAPFAALSRVVAGGLALAGAVAVGAFTGPTEAATTTLGYREGALGYDISWPQCPGSVFPAGPFDFAIIGVNGGKAMTQNPCFASQMAWARGGTHDPSVYLNTNSPPADFVAAECNEADLPCRSLAYGRAAALAALGYAKAAASDVVHYWLDVEIANSWATDTALNRQVLIGMIATLQAADKDVGIYSNSYQFGLIMGDYKPRLPAWIPGIAHGPPDGPGACVAGPSFGGGRIAMVQWTWTFDGNYVCPLSTLPERRVMPMVASG